MTDTVEPPKHGDRSCYVTGCDCDLCKAANAKYQREYMAKWRAAKKKPVE